MEMIPGKVINIPAEVKHWHGAAPDSWFSHLAIEVTGEETGNAWGFWMTMAIDCIIFKC